MAKQQKKAIIDDVAELAGVSKATVSRVMNRPGLVQDGTVKKVREAMEQLDYAPNAFAQSMRSQKSKTIGVIIPDIRNPFYAGMLAEIEKELIPYGYMLVICPTSGEFREEKEYVSRMIGRSVDGILYFTYNNSRMHIDEILSLTNEKKLPFILMDEPTEELQANQVITNGYAGMMGATEYLIKKGHTKIACACSRTEAASKRTQGYEDALKKHGIHLNKSYAVRSGFGIEDGEDAGRRILQIEDRPTAVVCVADSIAVGMMRQLIASGVRVPEDMEIIGFNGSELATIVTPQLSSVAQNMPELSAQAVRLMMDMIATPKKSKTVSIIKVEAALELRQSTT